MGTDIHLVVEARRKGVWERLDPPDDLVDDFYKKHPEYGRPWYSRREYALFTMLAGVRCVHGVEQIHPLRGLPGGFERPRYPDGDDWGAEHSYTWTTLEELQTYAKRLTCNRLPVHGVLNEDEFREWEARDFEGEPKNYRWGVAGRGVVHLSVQEMGALVHEQRQRVPGESYYCRTFWFIPYLDSAEHFFSVVLPTLTRETQDVPATEVRLVMGFDG